MIESEDRDEASEILKIDKLGRVHVPAERREAILDEFERSGMTGAAFARHHGINYQTFASWRQKRAQTRNCESNSPSPFLLVESVAANTEPQATGLEVKLDGSARMFIRSAAEAALAAELLRALR